jgi:hypothetical protein
MGSLNQAQTSSILVDSAPGHQEKLKPPSGGFFIYGTPFLSNQVN